MTARPTWYTEATLRRIARAGHKNLTEYAKVSGRGLAAMLKGFQYHGIRQSDVIMAERVLVTFEYAAEHRCSLRKAALATGWCNAATMRATWKRLRGVAS